MRGPLVGLNEQDRDVASSGNEMQTSMPHSNYFTSLPELEFKGSNHANSMVSIGMQDLEG